MEDMDNTTMSFPPDLFSDFSTPTADGLGLPDGDTTWVFETDADLAQMQTQLDFSADIEIPDVTDLQLLLPWIDKHLDTDAHAHLDLVAGQDSPTGHQTSNDSSSSVLVSPSTSVSVSSALFPWPLPSSSSSSSSSSSTPRARFPVAAEAQPPTAAPLQVNQCTSSRRSGGSDTCLTAALRALTALHMAHSACLSAHGEDPTAVKQQTRKMEAVLSTNKDVVAGMAPILACSCSARSPVQLLLLSICGNLIAWNSAMISAANHLDQGDDDDDPFSPASSALSADHTQPPPGGARVLPQPITIGQHQINGKLGRVLHTQVMAGELRILEGLVDRLSRRFCEHPRSDGAFSTSPTAAHMSNVNGRVTTAQDTPLLRSGGLPNVVHRQIISSLRTRLENTRAKIFSQG